MTQRDNDTLTHGRTAGTSFHVVVIGASARAAAESALRAGWRTTSIDLYGDADLREISQYLPVDAYPSALPAIARSALAGPYLYTGALENHPEIVDRIAESRTLLGNSGRVLRAVRNPVVLRHILVDARLPAPDCRSADNSPTDGRWLEKPLRSAGGRMIRDFDRTMAVAPPGEKAVWFQERISGCSLAAVFIADETAVTLAGVTAQLVGLTALGAAPFAYCGSVGPVTLPSDLADQIRRIGIVVARGTNLRGLFGIDVIVNDHGAWLIEVNPRYTASVEVLERAYDHGLLHAHRRAFEPPQADRESVAATKHKKDSHRRSDGHACVAKVVAYADRHVVFPELPAAICRTARTIIADRPRQGVTITAGNPICSILAFGDETPGCVSDISGIMTDLSAAMPAMHGCLKQQVAANLGSIHRLGLTFG